MQYKQFVYFKYDQDNKPEKAVVFYDWRSHGFEKLVLKVQPKAPVSMFAYQVERFNGGIHNAGTDYLVNPGDGKVKNADGSPKTVPDFMSPNVDWSIPSGGVAVIERKGYYLNGDHVILHRKIQGVDCLVLPMVTTQGKDVVYSRIYEWSADAPKLSFRLPQAAPGFKEAQVKVTKKQKGSKLHVTLEGKKHTVNHYISGCNGAEFSEKQGQYFVDMSGMKSGKLVTISSWITKSANSKVPKIDIHSLSTLTQGGKPYFTKTITVKGKLNADPRANGSGYAIDDIPVPMKNPYGVPMTITGLAFAKDGTGYIGTLAGDVWKVTGLQGNLEKVTWKRFASGIPQILGLLVIDDVLYVNAIHKLMKLHDYNDDGEADYYETFYNVASNYLNGFQRDAKGNFYGVTAGGGIMKIAPDGSSIVGISRGARNPMGIGVRPDGLVISDSSEGHNTPTCQIYESNHPENAKSVNPFKTILYIPRGVDNSPADKLFLDNDKFGPLGKSIFSASFGSGRIYYMMRDPNEGSPQAALCVLPMEVASGASRLAEHPLDKSIYIVGLDGWGDYAVEEGCLHRVRFTGEKCLKVIDWKAYKNGISFKFNTPVDPKTISKDK